MGRLAGLARSLPNPDLFVAMYVRQEAVFSSQIEGTRSSLDDLLAFEVDAAVTPPPADIVETVNYVRAMNLGLELLRELSVSGRLIRAVHGELLSGVRGQELNPGEYRRTQNWIGPAGCTVDSATFVPPAPGDLPDVLEDFEQFLQDRALPPLVAAGLAHAQFETIHPFRDGNGRVGRLLIALQLVDRRVLDRPLLYLSLFLKQNRDEYYWRLDAVRDRGDWEGWLRFFLQGVAITADSAARTAGAMSELREQHLRLAATEHLGQYAVPLLDLLAEQPFVTVKYATERMAATPSTTGRLLDRLTALGVVTEITGRRRNRLYSYSPFLSLLAGDDEPSDAPDSGN